MFTILINLCNPKEHSSDEKYQCKFCSKRFGYPAEVRNHEKKHREPQFKCGYCDKMLKSRTALLAHERDHTGERPFVCAVCGNGYKADAVLRTHMKHVHKILGPGMKPVEKRVRKNKETVC